MTPEQRYEWRYLPHGDRLHALMNSHCPAALCGVGVWLPSDWRGTGSQEEYERAASLTMCARCTARMVR